MVVLGKLLYVFIYHPTHLAELLRGVESILPDSRRS